eukprot:122353_1
MALSSTQYKQENEALRMENKYLRDSKLALVQATADEIERLRRFITLLSNALRAAGYRNIHQFTNENDRNPPPRNPNRSPIKKKTEWKYKQKQNEKKKNSNNITSNWYSKDSISPKTSAAPALSSLVDPNNSTKPSKAPMSLKERMNALQVNVEKPRASVKIEALKAERNLHEVKVTTTSKDNIASLFAAKIEKQKKSAAAGGMPTGSKGKILKEALKNPEPEKAAEVVESLGLFVAKEKTPNYSKKGMEKEEKAEEEAPVLEVLNMNNNVMMKKMSAKEKENMENIICDSLVKNEDLKCVQMCNADVNDAFLEKILNKLAENREKHHVTELWLESNPIGDSGMKCLASFMATDDKIQIVKLYNNKKTIST